MKQKDYTQVKIMGVLNVTPDSFSDGGDFVDLDTAIDRAKQMIEQGADIIDIGGESTRPGADPVSLEDELERTIPVIKSLRDQGINIDISIDTRRPAVAEAAIGVGATIWNDVTALTHSENSVSVAAELDCPVILMHKKGTPKNMQDNPTYEDTVTEVVNYLQDRKQAAIKAGVKPENIILDPGIGFGKRLEDNVALISHFDELLQLDSPVLIGTSRKSFISMITESEVDERVGGTLASSLWAMKQGASIIRVHDVKEMKQAVDVWQAIATSR